MSGNCREYPQFHTSSSHALQHFVIYIQWEHSLSHRGAAVCSQVFLHLNSFSPPSSPTLCWLKGRTVTQQDITLKWSITWSDPRSAFPAVRSLHCLPLLSHVRVWLTFRWAGLVVSRILLNVWMWHHCKYLCIAWFYGQSDSFCHLFWFIYIK